jgi:hypothetical protein
MLEVIFNLALGFSFMLLDSDIVTQIGLNIITNHIENGNGNIIKLILDYQLVIYEIYECQKNDTTPSSQAQQRMGQFVNRLEKAW